MNNRFLELQQAFAALPQANQGVNLMDPMDYQRLLGVGGWMNDDEPMNGWVAPRDIRGNAVAPIYAPRANRRDFGGIGNAQNNFDNDEDDEEPDHNHRHVQDRVEAELRRTIARLEEEIKEHKDSVKETRQWIRAGSDSLQRANDTAREYLQRNLEICEKHHQEVAKLNEDKMKEMDELRRLHAEEVSRCRKEKEDQKVYYETINKKLNDRNKKIMTLCETLNIKEVLEEKDKTIEELDSRVQHYTTLYLREIETRKNLQRQQKKEETDRAQAANFYESNEMIPGPSSPKRKRVQKRAHDGSSDADLQILD
ncbi:hypothetical protein CAEBREN_09575 [Caenorhabditis brenneri]|uniref:Uncharacterized protein n=1 Tax=Caenorhabditis brenneri TaxID=135651 RepID=G0MXB2_CAEBE|nr:hypothetical protein CAEBREN_09575 [Caenorhabditis brenneri]